MYRGWRGGRWARGWAIALLVAWLTALLLLTGCTPELFNQPFDGPFDGTELTLWQGIGPPQNRAVFEALVAQFNAAHPHIQVRSRYVGQPDQQIPKILTAVVGNATPDLLWYLPTLTGQLVELEALAPLDDWWQQTPHRDALDPALLGTMQLEGHLWSVPLGTNTAAIFYRPSLLAAAGLDFSSQTWPQTWPDLRRVAQQLTTDTDGDGQVDQHGILLPLGKGEWNVFCWLPFVYGSKGHLVDQGRPDLPSAAAALQFAADLVHDGSALLSAPELGYDITPLISGQVAMQITGPWVLDRLADVDYGVFPFPAPSLGDAPAAVLGGENIFLSRSVLAAGEAKVQAAYTFLDYILSPEFQLVWATQTGYLPVNLAVRASREYQQVVSQTPSLGVFLAQMAQARSRPILPNYAKLSETFGLALEATLLGQDPQAALAVAQEKLAARWPD